MHNVSLRGGYLPQLQKAAVITPVLKKPSADPEELKNQSPVSNLTFISKIIQCMVTEPVTRHLKDANLMPCLQPADKCHHSTETALMKVLSDTLDGADLSKVSLIDLLDFSAAFETVNHDMLLQ